MLTVDQYDYIRTAHRVYGKTIRQIARDTGHSKNTVKKALRSQFVGYPARARQPYPVLGPYLTTIVEIGNQGILHFPRHIPVVDIGVKCSLCSSKQIRLSDVL